MGTRSRLSLMVALMCLCLSSSAQSTAWPEYRFGDIFTISVPPTLELRDPKSADGLLRDTFRKVYVMNLGDVERGETTVFWPGSESRKYARIMVNVLPEDEMTQADMADMSSSDMAYLDRMWKEENTSISRAAGIRSTWIGSWREKVSGKYLFHTSYTREGLDGNVKVDQYKTFYKGREITFTISYRVSESSFWKKDLEGVIKTLKF